MSRHGDNRTPDEKDKKVSEIVNRMDSLTAELREVVGELRATLTDYIERRP